MGPVVPEAAPHGERERERLEKEQPRVLIGPRMCKNNSQMMRINWPRMSPEEKRRRLEESRGHLEFVSSLYEMQARTGRYFMHEHPRQATSWQEPCIIRVQKRTKAEKLNLNMCQYGMTTADASGEELPVLKATTVLTNMPAAQVFRTRTCQGGHRHCPLEGSVPGGGRRTELAQRYPHGLVEAMLKAIKLQAQWDDTQIFSRGAVEQAEGKVERPLLREEEEDY